MRVKNLLKLSVLVISIIFCVSLFSACSISDFITLKEVPEYITNTYINENGELVVEYSDNSTQNLGVVVGKDGKDGIDGTDGIDGVDGKDGANGADGKDGAIIIQGEENNASSLSYAVANSIQSAVIIQGSYTDPTTLQTGYSSGAGVIYQCNKAAGDAIIITNYHVVFNVNSQTENNICEQIDVFLYGAVSSDSIIEATYVGGSMHYDLAILKVTNSDVIKNSDVSAVNIKDSSKVHVGDTAFAIGNPKADGFSVTAGIVSVDSENIELTLADDETYGSIRVMRVDTPINSGNSGGGLFDESGNLIGIVNAKYSDAKIENIGYAIPSSTVVAIVENLLDYCLDTDNETIKRPLLGISVQIQNPHSKYDSETGFVEIYEDPTVVEIVSFSSIAFGKLQIGDIIRKVEIQDSGEVFEITRQYQLLDALLHARIGDTVIITVERNGEMIAKSMIITEDCTSNS